MMVRQPIELGLRSDRPQDAAAGGSFARVVPIWHRTSIAAVLAVVRDQPSPMFEVDDRLVIEAICERIEAAFVAQDLRDELVSQQTSPIKLSPQGALITEDLFERLAPIAGDVIFRHRFSAGTEFVSSGVETLLGYTAQEFSGDQGLLRRIIHPEDRHLLLRFRDDDQLYDRPIQIRVISRDGSVIWLFVRARPVRIAERILGIEGIATDVSSMKQTEAELTHQARSDPLTNLPNRLMLREYADRSIARLKRHPGLVGLLYLDLTGFKRVNDTMGHPAGDQAIVEVADRLSKAMRREDVVARMGGDEFAVLIPELRSVQDATATAQRIISALETPIEIDNQVVRISTGVGIAVIDSPNVLADELLANADTALLQAKRSGRGRWQVHEAGGGNAIGPDRESVRRTTDLLTPGAVRAAFASGAFTVHYLPIVDVTSGACRRVEALLRWNHPDLGLLEADDFLNLVEQADLLNAIDDWVLAQAARQVSLWNVSLSEPIGLSVNVTHSKLALVGFGDAVIATLNATGLPTNGLTVEVSEPAIPDLNPPAIAQLQMLREAGVRVAVDRFGIGSTSLRALRRISIDEVKIDRTLVAVLDPGRSAPVVDVEITKLALQVSQSFGAVSVAVGVEQRDQAETLVQLGCTLMQGRLFQRAVAAAEITSRIAAQATASSGTGGRVLLTYQPGSS
jgi:diguanylate cyclase (GGDEF)-like protein/PAS domain S-box-containing protein